MSLDPLPPRQFKRKNEWGMGSALPVFPTNPFTKLFFPLLL